MAGKAVTRIAVGVLVVIVVGGLSLFIPSSRRRADANDISNRMRSFLCACILYRSDHDVLDAWPSDIATVSSSMDLPADFLSPRDAGAVPPPHVLFVRPATGGPADQLVLIENPAIRPGLTMAAYADGSTTRLPRDSADALWAEAQRLAQSAEAADKGVPASAWAAAPEP